MDALIVFSIFAAIVLIIALVIGIKWLATRRGGSA